MKNILELPLYDDKVQLEMQYVHHGFVYCTLANPGDFANTL